MVTKEYRKLKQDIIKAGRPLAGDVSLKKKKISFKKGYKGKIIRTKSGIRATGGIRGLFKRKKERISRREQRTRKALVATGVITPRRQRGAGRPTGTYKHGMPIQQYKKAMAEKRALFRQQRQQELMRLKRRGLTEEQIQQLQLARTLEQQNKAIVPDSRKRMMQQAVEIADDEKEFTRFRANKMISPNTQRMLTELRRTQNKGEVDNIEMQRKIYERRLIAEQGNLLKAKNLFGSDSNTLNILEVEGNILTAPNAFRENSENNLLRQKRLNILQTREGGNDLGF